MQELGASAIGMAFSGSASTATLLLSILFLAFVVFVLLVFDRSARIQAKSAWKTLADE